MRFSTIFASLLSLAAVSTPLVSAQGIENNENAIIKPAAGETWNAGTPFSIEWTASANPGTVSIQLVKGVPGNLQVVDTIAPNVANNGKFEWTPPLSLEGLQTMPADQVYQFKIVTDASGNFGFSPAFKIDSPASTFQPAEGGAVSSSAESSATAATATTETSASTEVSTTSSVETTSASETTSSEVPTTTSASAETVTSSSETVTSTSEISSSASTSAPSSSVPTTLSTSVKTTSSTPTDEPTKSTDLPASETSSDPSETTSSTPAPATGLPTAAIAGITAGIIALIILAIIGVFLFRRRKQHSRTKLRGETPPPEPSKYDRDFQMMERRARHRPTSSFGFNTSRSDTSGVEGRNDPYVQLGDRDSVRDGTWTGSRF